MFAKILKEKYPFVTEYFEKVLSCQTSRLPNSVVLWGLDPFMQYAIALNVAKILNCTKTKQFLCNCQNCRWIEQNIHPEIRTVSKFHFKPENDKSQTVISVKQTELLKNTVTISTSDYFRVSILTDCDFEKRSEFLEQQEKMFQSTGFSLPETQSLKKDEILVLKGLNPKVFQEEASNSILKLIEEPPKNTMFFFLAKDKTDLLETILSRSICLCVNCKPCFDATFSHAKELLNPNKSFNPFDFIEIVKKIEKDENISFAQIIEESFVFCKNTIEENFSNKLLVLKCQQALKILLQAQSLLDSYLKENIVVERTAFEIHKIFK